MTLTTEELDALSLTLFDIGAVQIGKFKLHSGRKSNIYLDLRLLVSHPAALRQATAAYSSILESIEYDLLAAAPMAGLPIGTAICLDTNMPLIYPRKASKNYGTGKSIEGQWKVGQTAVIIDDLVTSGDSIIQAAAPLKAAGLRVIDAVVLVDREQGGISFLREEGYNLRAVLTITHLLSVLQSNGRITAKQRAKALRSLGK